LANFPLARQCVITIHIVLLRKHQRKTYLIDFYHIALFSSSNPHSGFISHEDQIENLDPTTSAFYPLTPEAIRAIEAIEYITNHLKKDEEIKMVKSNWKFVSMVVDRFLLYVFFGVTLGGTIGESLIIE
jgi:hypothetical protein